jgi:hypothetical protein
MKYRGINQSHIAGYGLKKITFTQLVKNVGFF